METNKQTKKNRAGSHEDLDVGVLGHLPGVFPWIQARPWAEATEAHLQLSPTPGVEPKPALRGNVSSSANQYLISWARASVLRPCSISSCGCLVHGWLLPARFLPFALSDRTQTDDLLLKISADNHVAEAPHHCLNRNSHLEPVSTTWENRP